jgi:Na+-transporting NADH:ubiquinone oxidoreductase subunit C
MKFVKETAFIIITALVFAGITAGVHGTLISRIRLNKETRNTRYLLDVMGIGFPTAADPAEIRAIERRRVEEAEVDGMKVYRSLDKEGRPTGYVFPIRGKGFWGPMRGFVALGNDLDTIKGIVFTSHEETPGLGARVDERWFRDQFKGIKLSKSPGKDRFVFVGGSPAGGKNRVDAVTGATMTSNAVDRFLNADLRRIVALKDRIRRMEWPSRQRK